MTDLEKMLIALKEIGIEHWSTPAIGTALALVSIGDDKYGDLVILRFEKDGSFKGLSAP